MAKQKIGTIDVTPKWERIIPLLINWIQTGNPEQRKSSVKELKRVAKILDALMAHRKCGGLKCKCGETIELS